MDAQHSLGTFLGADVIERDAVHVAIVPVTYWDQRNDFRWGTIAGSKVKFRTGSTTEVIDVADDAEAVGILDPFIRGNIENGMRVWLFLMPNTATGLRHHYHHPVLDAAPTGMNEHEVALRQHAEENHFRYDELIEALKSGDGWVTSRGWDNDLYWPTDSVWQHFEALTGKVYSDEHRNGVTYSCSC